ncbi:MAG: hypothetical protein GXY28_13290 [Bacteriovoracaceae bacterium]|nr:hypothetical protein [Bacteriovoracaceae bacterium]
MNAHTLAGWLTILILLGAFSTFFLKQIGREYVKTLPKEYADFADAYRRFMKFMVGKHRFFGAAALTGLFIHASLVLFLSFLSASGLAAGLVLVCVAASGAYGFFLRRSLRSGWLTVHRSLAFALFLAVVVHLVFKGIVYL